VWRAPRSLTSPRRRTSPPGNVYYYFKTKDEIITAVVQAHVQHARTAVAAIGERHRAPKSRLKALLGELASQSEIVTQYGCPHGSLCCELDKRPGGTDFALAELLRVPIDWAEQQFLALGRHDAHDLAMSLLASYQGSSLLTNTLRDPGILIRETHRLTRWTACAASIRITSTCTRSTAMTGTPAWRRLSGP
jgi:AcrR family transcriptional regulator